MFSRRSLFKRIAAGVAAIVAWPFVSRELPAKGRWVVKASTKKVVFQTDETLCFNVRDGYHFVPNSQLIDSLEFRNHEFYARCRDGVTRRVRDIEHVYVRGSRGGSKTASIQGPA